MNGDQSDNSVPDSGAAYVFVRNGNIWSQQAYLKAPNLKSGDEFGASVSISGDTLVVGGSVFESDVYVFVRNGSSWSQQAHLKERGSLSISGDTLVIGDTVFVRNNNTWRQQAVLQASNADVGDGFTASVSISGDTIVIGATGEDSHSTGVNGEESDNSLDYSGAAYVFVRNGETWSQQAYLKASNTDAQDRFGHSVSISGDTLIVSSLTI